MLKLYIPTLDLCFHDLQYAGGTGLHADAAGNTFAGYGRGLRLHHYAEGAGFHAFAAAGTFLFVDHVNALRVLGDRFLRTGFRAFAALYADHWLRASVLFNDLNAGFIRVEFLIKAGGTCDHTLQTCHTFRAFYNFKFLHIFSSALLIIFAVTKQFTA